MPTNPNLGVPLTVEQVRGLLACETVFFSPTEEHGLTRPMFHELLAVWLAYHQIPPLARPQIQVLCPCDDCAHAREVERRKEAQGV